MAGRLKDPESAKFGKFSISDDGTAACGSVNAKNAFGGYTGERFFMYDRGEIRFNDPSASPPEQMALSSCCFAQLSRAQGRTPTDQLDKDLEADCAKLVPPVTLRPVSNR